MKRTLRKLLNNILFYGFFQKSYTRFEYLLLGVVIILEMEGYGWFGIIIFFLGMLFSAFLRVLGEGASTYKIKNLL